MEGYVDIAFLKWAFQSSYGGGNFLAHVFCQKVGAFLLA